MEAPLSPEQQYWIIQPLLRAGLGLDEIRDLVFRLGFEAVVTEGASAVVGMHDVVSDQPAEIRAAWNEMIGRMIALRPSGGHGHGETGPSSPDDDPDA